MRKAWKCITSFILSYMCFSLYLFQRALKNMGFRSSEDLQVAINKLTINIQRTKAKILGKELPEEPEVTILIFKFIDRNMGNLSNKFSSLIEILILIFHLEIIYSNLFHVLNFIRYIYLLCCYHYLCCFY